MMMMVMIVIIIIIIIITVIIMEHSLLQYLYFLTNFCNIKCYYQAGNEEFFLTTFNFICRFHTTKHPHKTIIINN